MPAGSMYTSEQQLEKLHVIALYMVGFVIFLGGLVWAAVVAGVPQLYIGIGVLVLLGIGIFSAVSKTRSKDPPV